MLTRFPWNKKQDRLIGKRSPYRVYWGSCPMRRGYPGTSHDPQKQLFKKKGFFPIIGSYGRSTLRFASHQGLLAVISGCNITPDS